MGSVNFSKLCVYPNIKLPPKFKMHDFQKDDCTICPIAHLHLYGGSDDPIFRGPKGFSVDLANSLTGPAITGFTHLDHFKIKT